ncbi:acetolactate synthase large subunit [Brevibacterium sp. BDJS002]|uniref:acetolactate synthase large subunit n=1 Tax=Brevibacterium sp. BDJS002 TaxID=3020906 RepID=UPI002306F0FB|nr:acetolactate synthase large subunit [Brevibacterium sp. BDJS002]WCE41431.1 acetolactate synthase large subunit [Brevibacterium sp. BDJS002]
MPKTSVADFKGDDGMNGAESLLETLGHNGIEVCFANPGTSEMHFVAALDRQPHVRGVLGLFEGVVTGAADGYSRMLDKPAATLLHLGPGAANGLSSLHNALRARASMVNIIGDHAGYHRSLDAPLTSDIEGAVRPFSNWVRTSPSANSIAKDAADAIGYSLSGQISSLILPADTAWNTADEYTQPVNAVASTPIAIDPAEVAASAARLRASGRRTAILLGGRALRSAQLETAAQIAEATGATLLAETFAARTERGAGRPAVTKIPYPVEPSVELLKDFDALILIDAKPPVAFFAYPDKPSVLTAPGTTFFTLSPIGADSSEALEALRECVGVGPSSRGSGSSDIAHSADLELVRSTHRAEFAPAQMPSGTITVGKLAAWLSGAIPENAIVLDESITTGRDFYDQTAGSHPHDYLGGTGGSIGWALPVGVGAAISSPDRKAIVLESDGSGMYNPQALWTYAREQLDVVVLIFANRKYQILRNEMSNVGVPDFGPKAESLLDIGNPAIDWVSLSHGMGVPASRVETIEELDRDFRAGLADSGPRLIEVLV